MLKVKETLWKNNLNFVKGVPMVLVNVIIIVIIISKNKNRRQYFRTAPRRIGIRSNSRNR